MRRWELSLPLEGKGRVPLAVQIARGLAAQIRSGALRPGEVLPGSRTLAASLGVSRSTVYAAYEELKAEGWIHGSRARGCFVSPLLSVEPPTQPRGLPRAVREWSRSGFPLPPFAAPPAALAPPLTGKDDLHWDFGVPDVRLAPAAALARALRRVLRARNHRVLDYARYSAPGPSALSGAVAQMLSSRRALPVGAENVLITRGSQMALYLLARGLFSAGDVVAVEDPGYFSAWDVFRAVGVRLVPVPVDEEGLCVDRLAEVAKRQKLRAVFVTPHHQFPTTATLSASRRVQLLALARRHRWMILEDDYDHELHYDGSPVLPLASTDGGDGASRVVYVGSLSKVFAPGLRLGYLVASSDVLTRVRHLRSLVELQGDLLLELAMAELFEDGELLRHLNRSRRIYRARRDFLLQLLDRKLGGVLQPHTPRGGMALWAAVAPELGLSSWSERARARGLSFRTGGIFSFRPRERPFVRLGFARFDEAQLEEAVARMVKALPVRATRARGRRP